MIGKITEQVPSKKQPIPSCGKKTNNWFYGRNIRERLGQIWCKIIC